VGCLVGLFDGRLLGLVGLEVGLDDGFKLGSTVGWLVGIPNIQ
jgi:hypothetical protein